jgi:hypothetical protein
VNGAISTHNAAWSATNTITAASGVFVRDSSARRSDYTNARRAESSVSVGGITEDGGSRLKVLYGQ